MILLYAKNVRNKNNKWSKTKMSKYGKEREIVLKAFSKLEYGQYLYVTSALRCVEVQTIKKGEKFANSKILGFESLNTVVENFNRKRDVDGKTIESAFIDVTHRIALPLMKYQALANTLPYYAQFKTDFVLKEKGILALILIKTSFKANTEAIAETEVTKEQIVNDLIDAQTKEENQA